MKLFAIALAGLTCVGPLAPAGAAQSVASSARAKILISLSVTKNADLDMGTHVPGAGPVTVAATSPNAGKFTATGSADTEIQVTFPSSIVLSNGASTLSLTTSVRGRAQDNQASSTVVTSGNKVTLSATNRYYFWLGGTTTVGAATPVGTYVGSFTLTVQY